ncbi:DUF2569 family protein [Neobacillus sp. WH10]|uniref:DUF2569 family protein n=1 Tax=Neobacillus sp. WH10 TaxID=3047873 RepID=UPI0024C1CAB4|nr:DUF2569 family protein [Neobacillus sp. WH10]WHY75694.1 DUF2569 family protein [Neobacillus sp. WH10]
MEKARPIGGWLVLHAIGLIGGLIIGISFFYRNLGIVLNFDFDALIMDYSAEYAYLIYFETFYPFSACVFVFLINLFLIYLFFTKNKEYPRAFIYLNITNVFIIMSLEFVTELSGKVVYFQETIISSVILIIWAIYLTRSQRVKETFIHSRRKKYVKITAEEYELLKQTITNKGENIEL